MAAKQDLSRPGPAQPATPGDPIDLSTSVAGEEDPGASVVFVKPTGSEGRPAAPAGGKDRPASSPQPTMAPGDEAPVGTPSSGEDVCPECGGTGRIGAGKCPNCLGTGVVIVGIGGS